MVADFFGHRQGAVDARANGWALQVIAGEEQAGKASPRFFDGCQTLGVTEIVLRKGARPDGDV